MEKPVKTWCYKKDCDIVETGFQYRHNFFYVCKTCKEETSQQMFENHQEKIKEQERLRLLEEEKQKEAEANPLDKDELWKLF